VHFEHTKAAVVRFVTRLQKAGVPDHAIRQALEGAVYRLGQKRS
jgi:hypothetical protein